MRYSSADFVEALRTHDLPVDRAPDTATKVRLPAGLEVISADCHWSLPEDIWHEAFPKHLKDRAPRVWCERGAWTVGFDGKSIVPNPGLDSVAEFDLRPGSYELGPRLKDMDAEGISQEIVFPNLVFGFLGHPDHEVREWIWRIYNEYAADVGKRSGGRFHGVGVAANWWDPDKATESVQQLCDLGLKTFALPTRPGKFLDGRDVVYSDKRMDPLWSAIEESGLPVCFHVGEGLSRPGPGGMGTMNLVNFGGFREQLGLLIYGGVFDRHPKLTVVFCEAGINWAISAMQDAESLFAAYHGYTLFDRPLKETPSHYWNEHCYVTFITDPIGLRLLDLIDGADHVMWSSDYPHAESSLGYSRQSMQAVIDATSEADARKILGGTAAKVFKLD
jgi:predicted TIM-barrel fold metal-dependent hydrolase